MVQFRALSVLALLLVPTLAQAQDVAWRHDFAAARKEAREKQRPMFLDFGTVNCFWCKKLDLSTFRDPAIVRLLNEQFIPVKIDADREPALAQSMRVQSYPTLVALTAEGRTLWRLESYIEAGPLGQQLGKFAKESATSETTITTRTTAPPVPPLIDEPRRVIRGQSP